MHQARLARASCYLVVRNYDVTHCENALKNSKILIFLKKTIWDLRYYSLLIVREQFVSVNVKLSTVYYYEKYYRTEIHGSILL